VAASVVVVHHALELDISPWYSTRLPGYLAVDMFFVLSGFVLALTYADAFAPGRGNRAYWDFLARRIARIYPIFLVVLAWTVARMVVLGPHLPFVPATFVCIAINALLIQGWGLAPALIAASWSVSTEIAAYVAFPLLLRGTLFCRPVRALGAAIAAMALLGTAVALAPRIALPGHGTLDIYDGMTVLPLLRCIAGFVFGLLMFRLALRPSVIAIASRNWVAALLLGALVVTFALQLGDLAVYPLFPAIVLVCYANRGWVERVLGHGITYWLGVLSYATYLVHSEVYWELQHLVQHWGISVLSVPAAIVFGVTAFAIILGAAALAHVAIEVPGRRLVRRWLTLSWRSGWCRFSGAAAMRTDNLAVDP
jgi:peptidoglycan/LPS O-acetylase OafA/YrhL